MMGYNRVKENITFRHRKLKAPDMGDLLAYFEARSRTLDEEGQSFLDPSTLQFMSLIKFNGISILPPVMDQGRREEMLSYKHEAIRREKCSRAKKREELHTKVQSIVAGLEERRAAKQASKTSPVHLKSPPSHQATTNTRPSTEVVTSKGTGQQRSRAPSEIIINVTDTGKGTNSPKNTRSNKSPSTSGKPTASPSRSSSHGSGDSKKKEYTNYKSLGKVGVLSKQKSYSSQHLERTGTHSLQYDSDASSSSTKNLSLSPNSKALLPHPPVGRPPSRGSSMRQSSSTPDLRHIDASVKPEDLKKPLPQRRSLSPKGGRPQTKTEEKVIEKTSGAKVKDTKQSNKPKTGAGESAVEQNVRKNETVKQKSDLVKKERMNKSRTNEQLMLQNPLELLEQELSIEKENELKKRFNKPPQAESEVRQELDPIQTATAELFPFPISEEQALATLDSLHSDFASLEQADSLPKDYNGIPLTSLKQQQIIHMLTKLSKALNMEDTLTSAVGSDINVDPSRQEIVRGQSSRVESSDPKCVQTGASVRGHSEMTPMSEESAVISTIESSTNSSYQNISSASTHSRARMSPTSSSILSSASSVSASRSRMSPKSFKNTVHFSTLVTEISTSASQSYEDKISYRKLDITPKSSENFDEDQIDDSTESKNFPVNSSGAGPGATGSGQSGGSNLLSKVALSPSVESSQGSPGEFTGQHPFESSSPENELNTSDKENEFVPTNLDNSDEHYSGEVNVRSGRNQPVLNVFTAHIPPGPIGENHPAVVKSGIKTDGFSLKDGQEKILQENSQYFYGTNSCDLERYMYSKVSERDSISSMQEEITRSYLLSQSKTEIFHPDHFSFKKPKNSVIRSTPLEDMDESSIFLQPVIFTNTGGSLQENRSMLDDEEIIRSNLQRVQLEDTNTDHSEDEEAKDVDQVELDSNHGDDKDVDPVQQMLKQSEFTERSTPHGELVSKTPQCNDQTAPTVYNEHEGLLSNNESEQREETYSNIHEDDSDMKSMKLDSTENLQFENAGEPDELGQCEIEYGESKEIKEERNKNQESCENGSLRRHVEACEEDSGELIRKHISAVDTICIKEVNEVTSIEHNMEYEPDKVSENNGTMEAVLETKKRKSKEAYSDKIIIKEIPDNHATDVEKDDEPVRTNEMAQEEAAKAEHIQRYLNQVHEHSLHHEDDDDAADDGDMQVPKPHSYDDVMGDIGNLIQSFTSSIQSMNHLSQEELFRLQTEQFELIQQKLIEHQRAQLEELFVSQRREQMNLQREIEEYQTKIKDVDQVPVIIPVISAPLSDILQPQMSNSLPQVTQAWQPRPQQPIHSSAKSPPFRIQPVASDMPFQNPNMSFNTSYSTIAPFPDPRMCMIPNIDPRSGVGMTFPLGYVPDPNVSSISHNTSYSTIHSREPGLLRGNLVKPQKMDVILSQDPGSSQTSNPFIYPSSPSLYLNPKDRDNASVSDMSGFAKATPKQLVFSNVSTPVQPTRTKAQVVPGPSTRVLDQSGKPQLSRAGNHSAEQPGRRQTAPPYRDNSSHYHSAGDNSSNSHPGKSFKPVQHSPMKAATGQRWTTGRYLIPPEVFDPAMYPKFCRVSAAVKGYLTRRLLKTSKVQDIIKTIEDTRNFAFSFQSETPIKKGTYSREDWTLLERIVNQLQAALLDIHEVFFVLPISERMAIISAARQVEEEKRLRESQRSSLDGGARSLPKLSKATLKALERKKKAQLAEEAVFGSMEFRPKSAPPATSSPHPSTDIRALRPLQGQISPITGDHHITIKEVKERPRTAPEKRKSTEQGHKVQKTTSETNQKTSKSSSGKTSKSSASGNNGKQKTSAANTKSKKLDKAWR